MEIEIVTTNKKITKSIINQMAESSTVSLKFGTSLGYLMGVRKNSYKAILIQYDNKFSIISSNYIKGEKTVYRKTGRWSRSRRFDSIEECNIWWEAYQARLKEAYEQIYI